MNLISLIGEQPIPNLLAHRALKPDKHILACTETTERVATNLAKLLDDTEIITVSPYDFHDTYRKLTQTSSQDTIINLTAGTKPMALAAYETARSHKTDFVYLQSQGKKSLLYHYGFSEENPTLKQKEVLRTLINIDDYLIAHGLKPKEDQISANNQETALRIFLEEKCDEIKHNLQYPAFEIDFIIRRGNQVAIIEAKYKKENKRNGLDQLNTIAGREHLGIYTGKIWVVKNQLGKQLKELAKAYQVEVVVTKLVNHAGKWRLKPQSEQRLSAALDKLLGPQQ